MKTKNYYDNNAQGFVDSTFTVDMQSLYQPFLNLLPDFGRILDLGCGSGRDALAFKNMGYQIKAMDYSEELVKQARKLTGIDVKLQSFYES